MKKRRILDLLVGAAEIVVALTISVLVFLILYAATLAWMGIGTAEAELMRWPVAYVDVQADSYLNVRETPGGEKTQFVLRCREDVVLLMQQDGWALVIRPDKVGQGQPLGWACMDYLHCYREFLWALPDEKEKDA